MLFPKTNFGYMITEDFLRIQLLRPSDVTQREILIGAIAEILWKVMERERYNLDQSNYMEGNRTREI